MESVLREIRKRPRKGVAVFDARIGDLSRESLCDFDRFANAPTLRNQAWNIGARGEKAAFLEWLDM